MRFVLEGMRISWVLLKKLRHFLFTVSNICSKMHLMLNRKQNCYYVACLFWASYKDIFFRFYIQFILKLLLYFVNILKGLSYFSLYFIISAVLFLFLILSLRLTLSLMTRVKVIVYGTLKASAKI